MLELLCEETNAKPDRILADFEKAALNAFSKKFPDANQFEAAGEGVARTTNSVEGWHYGLQAYFTGSQPNVWLLLRNLEKDSKMQKFEYLQETTGIVCSKRPRYEKIKKQMQVIQSGYTFENVLPHLRAVANFR